MTTPFISKAKYELIHFSWFICYQHRFISVLNLFLQYIGSAFWKADPWCLILYLNLPLSQPLLWNVNFTWYLSYSRFPWAKVVCVSFSDIEMCMVLYSQFGFRLYILSVDMETVFISTSGNGCTLIILFIWSLFKDQFCHLRRPRDYDEQNISRKVYLVLIWPPLLGRPH